MRLRPGSPAYRDRLLDAMALLLVDLHRGGVYWGDCSLANTLFRRDGDRIQAYLVDAETSEIHPGAVRRPARVRPRDPRRERRLRPRRPRRLPAAATEDMDEAIDAAESVRDRLRGGVERAPRPAGADPGRPAGDPRARCGGSTTSASPWTSRSTRSGRTGAVRLRTSVTTRRYHASELERRTRHPGARGPGADPAQRPRRVPGVAGVLRAPAGRCPRRPPTAGCARSTGRRWPGSPGSSGRTGTSSRPTATCSSTSGCCPSRPAATSGSRRRSSPTWPRAPRRPSGPTARRPTRDPALDGLDLEDGLTRRARDPRDRRRAARELSSALPALAVHELVERPPAAGLVAGR